MSKIELRNVTKIYGDRKVLDNITIDINDREFIAIMGQSGSGKSTLLNIIGLLENINSGKVIIDTDENVKPNTKKATKILREKIGYLFQNFALIDEKTVEYNLYIALKYVKSNRNSKLRSIKDALEKVGLQGYEKKKIYELSGGEQQRVAIARVILKPCTIILADEPTGSLDETNRDIIINLLKSLNREGKTVVLVTHDKKVAAVCDRVYNI